MVLWDGKLVSFWIYGYVNEAQETNRLAHRKVVTEQEPEPILAQLTCSMFWLFVLSCFYFGVLLHLGMSWPVSLHSVEMCCKLQSDPRHLWKWERAWANPSAHQNREPQGMLNFGTSFIPYAASKWADFSCYNMTIQSIAESYFFKCWTRNTSGINMTFLIAILLFCLVLASNLLCPSSACFDARIIHGSLQPPLPISSKKWSMKDPQKPCREVTQSQML